MNNRILATLAVLALSLSTFGLGVFAATTEPSITISGDLDRAEALDVIEDAYDDIMTRSVDAPAPEDLAHGAIRGMIGVLRRTEDPYAAFYTPRGLEAYRELTTGRFSGIGVWLGIERRRVVVSGVLPQTPAEDAGLKPGDALVSVDGRRITAERFEQTVGRIKGPEGTMVDLVVERDGRRLRFTVERASIELPNVQTRVVRGFGYIQLFGFARGAADQLRDAVERLIDQDVDGIVLDMRGNPGGLFREATDVASVFIEDGRIVTLRQRSAPDEHSQAEGDAFQDIPLVVLVDGQTASASEIVAGALQDHERATLVGTATFGKGSVQEVLSFGDASGVKLTTGSYLTPDGHNLNGAGIEPDVTVVAPALQRRRALAILEDLARSG